MIGLIAMTALAAFAPAPWSDIGAIPLPWAAQRTVAGWAVLAIALVVVTLAQAQMGASWRIGVDPRKTDLKARGLFAISRNPIFLGMRAMLFGLFLIMPNAFVPGLPAARRGVDPNPGAVRGGPFGGLTRKYLSSLPPSRAALVLSTFRPRQH